VAQGDDAQGDGADLFTGAAQRPALSPHAGHRERLRERALNGGLKALPDYELLEMLLFRSLPRQDTKAIAKALIARFGSFPAVLSTAPEELMQVKHVGEAAALDIKLAHEAALRIGREPVLKRRVIGSWTALTAYLRTALQHEGREQFRVLFLDNKNQLILDETLNFGTVDHAPVYPREVCRRALELSSPAVILVHNHPSGDPTPSAADIDITRQTVEAARPLKITVHDHVIVGRHGVTSFKALGLM
jgi:DNA repair protein RadC